MMSYKSENSVFLRPCLVGARQRELKVKVGKGDAPTKNTMQAE